MARPHDSERYDLSDAEKRDLIKLIEQCKPLPEKYRFLFFADKREVELVWNGKSREVCTAILPFQTLEHIDEPRKEQRDQGELGYDIGGRQVKGWTNKLIWGDNKLILSSLKVGALHCTMVFDEVEPVAGVAEYKVSIRSRNGVTVNRAGSCGLQGMPAAVPNVKAGDSASVVIGSDTLQGTFAAKR